MSPVRVATLKGTPPATPIAHARNSGTNCPAACNQGTACKKGRAAQETAASIYVDVIAENISDLKSNALSRMASLSQWHPDAWDEDDDSFRRNTTRADASSLDP